MTLQEFMMTYLENRKDIFVLHYSDQTEISRFCMTEYFCADFDTSFGDCVISNFMIGVVNETCLLFSIYLDIPNENEVEDLFY